MTTDLIMGIAAETMKVTLLVSAPVLLVGLVVGLVISIFQAVTQVNEMTLTFVPKLIGAFVAMLIFGPWMMQTLVSFSTGLFQNMASYGR